MGLRDKLSKNKEVATVKSRGVQGGPTPEMLIQQALDQSVSVEALGKLLAMRKELKEEMARDAFMRDLAGFQGECPVITKTKAVLNKDKKSIRYQYAPLDDIIEQISPYLSKWGFSYTIQTVNEKDPPAILSILTAHHVEGHSRDTEFRCPIGSTDFMTLQQAYASASTFSKRYCIQNGFGVITGDEDDDAQSGDNLVEEEKREVVKSSKYKADEKQIFKDVKNKHFNGKIAADGDEVNLTGVRAQVLEMLKKKVYSEKKIVDIKERVARFLLIAEERDAKPPEEKKKEPISDPAPAKEEIVVENPEVVQEESTQPKKSEEYLEIEAQMIRNITHSAFVGKVPFEVEPGKPKQEVDLGKYRRGLPDKLAKNILPIEDLRKKANIVALLLQASLDKMAPQDTPGHEKFTPPDDKFGSGEANSVEPPDEPPAGFGIDKDGGVDPSEEPPAGFVARQEEGTGTLFADLGDAEVDIEREGNLQGE